MRRVVRNVAIVLVVLAALAGAGIWWFETRVKRVFFARDAVQVIAYEASRMYGSGKNVARAELDAMIKRLHDASVINLAIDDKGRAVDPFGTAFRVEHEARAQTAVTTVTSAGPDRRFGTRDDIQFVHEAKVRLEDGAAARGVGREKS